MMVLALDAATDRLSVAAGHPQGRQAVRELSGARRHAGALPGLVLDALADLGAGLADVEALAVSDGPGSFTGLRVASSWAKGVWRVRSLPFWVASTLLVRAARPAVPGNRVIGVGSALRGEVYAAGYRFSEHGIETLFAPSVAIPGQGNLADLTVDLLVGDLPEAEMVSWGLARRVVAGAEGQPDARTLIDLVGVPGGARLVETPSEWEPEYGRPAEAQAKWERAHGRPLSDSTSRAG